MPQVMNKDVVEVQVRAVLPLEGSFAVFLGNTDKTFVIYVDEPVGTAISMFMRGIPKERPLTHDLMAHVLMAFGAKVERVVINGIQGSVFHARLIISAENELHARKVVELDARPSDSIAMAVQQGAPIFVAQTVWDSVDDMTEALEQIEKRGLERGRRGAGAAEASELELGEESGEEDEEEGDEDLDEDIDDEFDEFDDLDEDEEDGDEDDEDVEDEEDDFFDDSDEDGEEWKRADDDDGGSGPKNK